MITHSPKETKEFGQEIARKIFKEGPQERATVLSLVGDLGSGKTTFVQGFAYEANIRNKITSPTYVIMKNYSLKKEGFDNLYHIDTYRISGSEGVRGLGLGSILNDPSNIILVEWGDRIDGLLPENKKIVRFEYMDKKRREIVG